MEFYGALCVPDLFFVQRSTVYFGSVLEAPAVSAEGYLEVLGWSGVAALIWFLLVHSYATVTDRMLKLFDEPS